MTITDILSRYDEKTATLAMKLRDWILKKLNGVQEIPDGSANIIGYGFGIGYKDLICTILLSKSGVKLGLNGGASFPDPGKLLEGTGKVHRYVVIKNEADLKNPALEKLLECALKARELRTS